MKKLLAAMLIVSTANVFADVTPKVTIKEIKAHLKTINPETTCMDEYLKRRKQLIIKLAASPAIAVAGTVAATYVGAATAAGISAASNIDGWGALGYTIGGAMIGGASGIIAVGVDTTITAVTLNNIDLILRTLAEQHLDRAGAKTDKLHMKYLKKSPVDIAKDEFLTKLMDADASGVLCDGTLVKQPRIRIGTKLKFKVAKLKDVVKLMDAEPRG